MLEIFSFLVGKFSFRSLKNYARGFILLSNALEANENFQKMDRSEFERERERERDAEIVNEFTNLARRLVILVKGLNPKLIRKAKANVVGCGGESWKFAYLPCNYPFSWIIHIRQLEDNSPITLILGKRELKRTFSSKWIEFGSQSSFSLRLRGLLRIENFNESYLPEINCNIRVISRMKFFRLNLKYV